MEEFIMKSWGITGDRFPGPQPVSIERRHFSLLEKQKYFVCEKTDGLRYLLGSFDGGVFLVNRSFASVPLKIRVPKDTLLDGELVTTRDGRRLFMVHDAIRVKGRDLTRDPLDVRLEAARKMVKGIIKTAGAECEIRVKTMWPLTSIRDMPTEFEYETDGIVLTPIAEPIRTGTHETMFKWKPRDRITIDFAIMDGKNLYVQDKGFPFLEAELLTKVNIPDGSIVECGYGPTGWFVEKIRTDKTYANNRRTYFRTIINLRESIELREFYRYHAM
jgi:ATP-dependent DNA ligase